MANDSICLIENWSNNWIILLQVITENYKIENWKLQYFFN